MRRPIFALFLAVSLLLPLLSYGTPATPAALDSTFSNTLFEGVWSRTDLPVLRGVVSRSLQGSH